MRRVLVVITALGILTPCVAQTAKRVRVSDLTISGNRHFSDRELGRVMTLTPKRWREPRFHRGKLLSDVNTLIALYEGEGYLETRILERRLIYDDDSSHVAIHLRLKEGPRTIVSQFSVEGVLAYPDSLIRKNLRLEPGRPYRQRDLLHDRDHLQTLYSEDGRIDTRIYYEAIVDSAAAAIVHYRVEEGPPIRLAQVRLEGLEKTRPFVVQREVTMKPGDLLRHSDLLKTQTAVFSTGLFRSVIVRAAMDSSDAVARDVTILVRERDAGALDLGAGYGSSERLRVVASVAQTNWRGRGLKFGATGRLSRLLRTTEGVFTVPFVLGVRVALDGRIFYKWERNPQAAFRTRSRGFETTFSYQASNHWVADVAYSLQRVRFQRDEALYEPGRTTSSLGLGLRRDSRDNPLDSRAGNYIRTRLETAGGPLRGASNYNRATVELMSFRSIFGAILGIHTQMSAIDASGDLTRVAEYEQFYLGGDRSVRGYGRGEIGADRVGEIAFNGQFEVRLPVLTHGIVLFTDAGQVWRNSGQITVDDLRLATGGGLRYVSRFGLVRFDLAVAHEEGSIGERLGVYFGVGQAF